MSDSVPVLGGSLVLGRYRVVRELARGGMGMVYLGRIEGAAGFAKPVVIKRVLSHIDETTGSRAQFIREARLLSELHHPNIVGVIDFGEEDGSYLMVLEYVHGFHVGHWLKYALITRGALQWEFAVYVLSRVLLALHYAHTRTSSDGKLSPIIHRDVSPGNVLIDLDGNVRLLDFGIARTTGERDEAKTQDGIVKGKLPYIAPEMYQSKDASVASDVYAAGVMLYQLLAGRNPFSGKDMGAIVGRVLSFIPPPITSIRKDVPSDLDGILGKAMSKDPSARFESAAVFAAALGRLLPQNEADVLDQFRRAVGVDFTGEMADVLGIPGLSELDAAWRASSSDPESEQPLQRSSSLPPHNEEATAIISAPRLESLTSSTKNELSIHDQKTMQLDGPALAHMAHNAARSVARPVTNGGIEYYSSAQHQLGSGTHTLRPTTSTKTIVLSMLGAGLLAGVIAAAVLIVGKQDPPAREGQRFLLVERQGSPSPSPSAALPTPLAEPPAPSVATTPAPSTVATPTVASGAAASPKGPRATTPEQQLTAAFARRQGAVQSCFKTNSGGLEGSPSISIRFRVSAQGAVQSANLIPQALAPTALGQCLLSVAQGATFPAMEKDVAFSIPITAHVVNK